MRIAREHARIMNFRAVHECHLAKLKTQLLTAGLRSVGFVLVTCLTFFFIALQKVQALQQELNKLLEKESANFISGTTVSNCEGETETISY